MFEFRMKPKLSLGSDGICVVQLITDNSSIFIVSVYLPHQTCRISDYNNELSKLQNVIDECSTTPNSSYIIIGDLNASFPRGFDIRCDGIGNMNAVKLRSFVLHNDMTVADIGALGYGPRFTFRGWNSCTYLDHVIVSNDILAYIRWCCVLNDGLKNVSDHLALLVNMSVTIGYHNRPNACATQRVAWHRMTDHDIETSYALPLDELSIDTMDMYGYNEESLDNGHVHPDINPRVLDEIVDEFTNNMVTVSQRLPRAKYNKLLKPYWDRNLTELNRNKRDARTQWVNSGKVHNPQCEKYVAYKNKKTEFRRLQRQRIYELEKQQLNQFAEVQEIDQKYFWYKVNKSKTRGITTPVRSEHGTLLTDPNSIRRDWNHYYEQLYTENGHENFDNEFKSKIENDLKQMETLHDNEEFL